jgi:hypothetical protein
MKTILLRTALCGLFILAVTSCAQRQEVAMRTPADHPAEQPAEQPAPPTIPTVRQVYHFLPTVEQNLGVETRLSKITKEVAGKVLYKLRENDPPHSAARVAVVSAVPLSDFKRESEFGRLMAEYLLTDLADRGLLVTELRLGKEIHILPQTGEFILSRNTGELANEQPSLDYVVVSTFSNTTRQLIIQGRLVSLRDGLVKSAWRHTLPLDRELLTLFNEFEKPHTITVTGFQQ